MLEVLGLDRAGEGVYLALVDGAPMTVEEIENATGVQQPGLGGALARLESWGLIARAPGSPARYTALPRRPPSRCCCCPASGRSNGYGGSPASSARGTGAAGRARTPDR